MLVNRRIKKQGLVVAALIAVLLLLQLVQPPIPRLPVTHPMQAPEEVSAVLRRACYDCHSNETKLSWFDKVAPASWLVATDIQTARARFNFSTWDTLSPADQQGRMWEIVNMALTHKMPLASYAVVHPGSRLSAHDIGVLKKYAGEISPARYHDTAVINAAAKEYRGFAAMPQATNKELVAANGVKYINDYQNWQVISHTNRFDNHSIRVVYGNATAVKAIKDNHITPWPNGTTIVKVVWNSIEEQNGDIVPGSLNSVQIMTKDDQKFPDSKGWGFAKFNGIHLKPYGDTKLFNATCFNCHKIASENGYVFNVPLPNEELR